MRCAAWVLVLLAAPALAQEQPTAARVHAFFAELPDFTPPVEDLKIFAFPLADADAEPLRLKINAQRVAIVTQRHEVAERRELLERNARALLLSGVNWLRTTGGWFSSSDEQAEANFNRRQIYWCAELFRTHYAEKEFRRLAEIYYTQLFAHQFSGLEEAVRQTVLDWFETRLGALREKRREIFREIEKHRKGLWTRIFGLLETAWEQPDPATRANRMLRATVLERHYNWLVPETSLHLTVYGSLLDAHERAVVSGELHPALRRLQLAHRDWTPQGRAPPGTQDIRLKIVRSRARRAQLAEYRKEIENEAGFRTKASVELAVGAAVKEKGSKALQAVQEGVANNETVTLAQDVGLRGVAVATLAWKFSGDLVGLVVTGPLEDFFLDLTKPFWKFFGGDVKTSVEANLDAYLKADLEIERRIKLLGYFAGKFSAAQCLEYAAFIAGDDLARGTTSKPLPLSPRITLKSMLFDTQFIATTRGGLPQVLEILCEDPRQRAAVVLRSGQYLAAAEFNSAARRLGTARGLKLKDEDLASRRKTVEKLLAPMDPLTGRPTPAAERDVFLRLIPGVALAQAIWNLPRTTRTSIEYLKGNLDSQDDYLRQIDANQERIRFVLLGLGDAGFHFDRLHRKFPDIYEDHVRLMATSYPYVDAYRRLARVRSSRDQIYRWARHTPPDGTSTPRGEGLLVSLQEASDVESATLAASAAFLKLRHLALTLDYAGAAVQATELETLENMARRARGKPEVSLKAQAEAFRREALLGDLITIYEELYHATLKEVVLSVAGTALKNYYLGKTRPPGAAAAAAAGVPKPYEFPWKHVGERLWGAANPWAGKFGVNTVIGSAEGAIKKGFAQTLAKHQNMFTAAEIEAAADVVFVVTKDTIAVAAGDIVRAGADRYAVWREERRRDQEAQDAQQALDEHRETNVRPLEQELAALRRDGEDPERQKEIVGELIALNRDPNVELLRARLLAAQGDMDGAAERMRAVYAEAEETAELIASEMTRAHTLDRIRGADTADPDARRRLAAEFAAGDFRRRLARGEVSHDDLQRLVDPTDPLGLHDRVLRDELDLAVVRRAVESAMRTDPGRAVEIQTVALAIDKLRRRRVRDLAQEFVRSEGLEDAVETIAQDCPRANDPESAGLLDDIGLVVHLKDGDDAAQRRVEERFEAFLNKKGYAVGGRGALVARVRAGTFRAGAPPRRPRLAEEWDADTDLPPAADGRPLRRLDDDTLDTIERDQGFQKEHAAGMHRFAQQYKTFLVMRDGNPDSVKFFNNRDYMPKPQSCKAKTAKVGPHKGLVVDPTHDAQKKEWDDAIAEAEATDPPRARKLEADRQEAVDTWARYGEEMRLKGYRVNPTTGVVEFVGKDSRGRVRVWTGVHGDYDLHGAYRLMPDGTVRKIGFGGGSPASNARYARFRNIVNETLAAIFGKEFIQHGAQDNWDDPTKTSDPPVTVFFPDGRPPLRLETPDEMRRFYEGELGVQWEYRDGHGSDDPPPAGGPRPTPLGAAIFHSAAGAGWARNFLAYRGAAVYGSNRGRTVLEREQAHALALDTARHLGFLTDPRFLPDAVAAAGGVAAQAKRLDEAMAQGDAFLRLVDAYLIGHEEGHELYALRMEKRPAGYFATMAEDADKLARLRALDALGEDDVAKLRMLAALRGPDPWKAVGGRTEAGVNEALGLLDWMREKSADLVASASRHWTANHERLGPLGTPGERARSRESFQTIAKIAMEAHMRGGHGEMALLAPPVELTGTDARPIAVDAHRTRLRETMRRTLEQRRAIAKAQAEAREKVVAAYQGQPLDDELRAKLEKQLADAMRAAEVSVTRTARQSAREWILYAGLMGVEPLR